MLATIQCRIFSHIVSYEEKTLNSIILFDVGVKH